MKKKSLFNFIDKKLWVVFIFFLTLTFFLFGDLLNSYFEADEWFHFTYYLPLTQKPDGFFTAVISTFTNSGPLSAGQHVIPVASVIYYLNAKFFGLNYAPYAFMSLFFHTLNSFLVYVFIRLLFSKKETVRGNLFGILGGLFFTISPQGLHTITGASPFYGQNILSVTFFLLCIISFKLSYSKKSKKYIYLCVAFLLLSLFTKETSVFLFALLPVMALIEQKTYKKIFPTSFLVRLFVLVFVTYAVLRFLVPNVYPGIGPLVDKLVWNYVTSSLPNWEKINQDSRQNSPDLPIATGPDISLIHKNLPAEIMFRTVTFPIRMTGTLFIPRETLSSMVKIVTPIIYPAPSGDPGARATGQLQFTVGPGNDAVLYIISIFFIILVIYLLFHFSKKKRASEFQALSIGLSIIILSALPLVAIIFSFPTWGYDTYFDSRFNYNPNVGAALVFPFLIIGIARIISKIIQKKSLSLVVVAIIFVIWLANNMFALNTVKKQFISKYSKDRKEFIGQLTEKIPKLPKKIVFYAETDGRSPYGPNLPFETSVPMALTVVYYEKSPLPDSFYEKPLFEGKGQGYTYSEGRGFGYYSTKKKLAEDLSAGKIKTSDIYGFFYEAEKVKLHDITVKIRKEMKDYLEEAKKNSGWKKYSNDQNLSFLYPPETNVHQADNSIILENPNFTLEIFIIDVSTGFNMDEFVRIYQKSNSFESISKKVEFDKFHSNDSIAIMQSINEYPNIMQSINEYPNIMHFIKLKDKLIFAKTLYFNPDSLKTTEKILGSIGLIEE